MPNRINYLASRFKSPATNVGAFGEGAYGRAGAHRREHALNANLIFKWLKDRRFAPADAVEAAPVFLPVEIHGGEVPAARMASPAHGAHGRVEIVLATAHRLIVEGQFDADALARLLSVLARLSGWS